MVEITYNELLRLIGNERSERSLNPAIKKSKKKPSAWNKFVKTNSKKKKFQYRDGKINLKKLGVAYRKTKR